MHRSTKKYDIQTINEKSTLEKVQCDAFIVTSILLQFRAVDEIILIYHKLAEIKIVLPRVLKIMGERKKVCIADYEIRKCLCNF